MSNKEEWYVELRYANKAWHSYQDAHYCKNVTPDQTHTLDYCLKFIKKKRSIFSDGQQSGINYRLHDHVTGAVIPFEALGI